MKKNVIFAFLLLGTLGLTTIAHAQDDQFAYAMTDLQPKGKNWMSLRKLDLTTGKFGEVLLNVEDTKTPAQGTSTQKGEQGNSDAKSGKDSKATLGTGVAAMAYDSKNQRVYFIPTDIDQLRYIDLKTMRVSSTTDKNFSNASKQPRDEGKIISRMTITPEGIGYAFSNDGSSFIRFTTDDKQEIQQLGPLTDDSSINGVSLSNYSICGGGDMVADEDGNLYLFTGRNNVYKIDPKANAATLIGYIRGLPKDFNTDGAAVTVEGKVLVSSGGAGSSCFLVDPKNWRAAPYEIKDVIFPSSDLANSNYLRTQPKAVSSDSDTNTAPIAQLNSIVLYPNPITDHQFNLRFEKITVGSYRLEVRNVMDAQIVLQRDIKVHTEGQVETISVASSMHGIYVVKIIGADKTAIYTQKIVVE